MSMGTPFHSWVAGLRVFFLGLLFYLGFGLLAFALRDDGDFAGDGLGRFGFGRLDWLTLLFDVFIELLIDLDELVFGVPVQIAAGDTGVQRVLHGHAVFVEIKPGV